MLAFKTVCTVQTTLFDLGILKKLKNLKYLYFLSVDLILNALASTYTFNVAAGKSGVHFQNFIHGL